MTTGKALNGKPYAGNPHVRFDEGAGAPRHSGRSALLYMFELMRRCVAIGAAAVAFSAIASQDRMREDFASPSGVVRENTGPLFWLHGTESEVRLREYVRRVAESGQGMLTIESRPHKEWMKEGWWRDVDIVLDECRRRGLKLIVFDDYFFPSQYMGGKFPIPKEYSCHDVRGKVYAHSAAPAKASNEVARVTVREVGKGVFKPCSDGEKTIVYTSSVVRRAMVNGLDEAAVDWFLENFYAPYWKRYRSAFEDGTIIGFFFDEPFSASWWGPALADELAARGDDPGELLTALKFRLADPESQSRALYRYHDARAETLGRTMYGRQSEWCRKHGVFSSGHFFEHEETYYHLTMGAAGDVMRMLKYVEVPGVDLVCRQYYPNQRQMKSFQIAYGQMPKYASSAAHVYNRHNGFNWCEIFGAYFQDLTYPQMKWMCDWHQYQGCYCLIPHSFNPQSPFDKDCPPYFYNGGHEPRYPLFRVWADYNNRCALLLSNGEHVCHVLQCVPGISYHVGKTIRPEMFAFALQDAQLDGDWAGYDVVETAQIAKNPRTGRLALRTLNGKEHYDVLSLPATEYVPFAALEKALAFAKAGGVVAGYGIRPCKTPTKGKTSDDVKHVVDAIFAQPTAVFFKGEPDGAAVRTAFAKPHPDGEPLVRRHFDFAGLVPDDAAMLAVDHYEKDGKKIIFIANQDIVRRRKLSLRSKWPAEEAELWDPMQGTVEKPEVENGMVKLTLEPSQSMFVVWPCGGRGATALPAADVRARAPLPRVNMPNGRLVSATVKEIVTPMAVTGEACSENADLEYARWIWHPVDPEREGKVTFRAKIDSVGEAEARIVFACDNSATVFVNGKEIARQNTARGTDLYGGWRAMTRARFMLKAGRNDIVVHAENTIPGFAGFIASIVWPEGNMATCLSLGGGNKTLKLDSEWTVEREGEAPVKPLVLARYGGSPWGRLGKGGSVTASPYSESVATELVFTLPALGAGERVYLACDDVEGEKSAAITVNGAYAGGFIGAPYRLDITKSVKPGANTLETKPFRLKNPRIVLVK